MKELLKKSIVGNLMSILKNGDILTFKDNSKMYWNDTDDQYDNILENYKNLTRIERYVETPSSNTNEIFYFLKTVYEANSCKVYTDDDIVNAFLMVRNPEMISEEELKEVQKAIINLTAKSKDEEENTEHKPYNGRSLKEIYSGHPCITFDDSKMKVIEHVAYGEELKVEPRIYVDMNKIKFKTFEKAKEVLKDLLEIQDTVGLVRLSDLCGLADVSFNLADTRFGWKNLREIECTIGQINDDYVIYFPALSELK